MTPDRDPSTQRENTLWLPPRPRLRTTSALGVAALWIASAYATGVTLLDVAQTRFGLELAVQLDRHLFALCAIGVLVLHVALEVVLLLAVAVLAAGYRWWRSRGTVDGFALSTLAAVLFTVCCLYAARVTGCHAP